MEIKDLKLMLFVDAKKEVVLRSENNYNYHNVIYTDWHTFLSDTTIDDLILDEFGFGIIVGPNTIVLWVA